MQENARGAGAGKGLGDAIASIIHLNKGLQARRHVQQYLRVVHAALQELSMRKSALGDAEMALGARPHLA
jgi:hypothetical protein